MGVGVAYERLSVDPEKMGGQTCIRGLRFPVATVVGMVADGMSTDEILADFPDLKAADITEALRYAAEAVRERELPLIPPTEVSQEVSQTRRTAPNSREQAPNTDPL